MALLNKQAAQPAPSSGKDLLLADLDGVIYRSEQPLSGAVTALTRAQETMAVGYITNNASRPAAQVAQQLRGYGLQVTADQIVTSPQAAVRLLAQQVPPGSRVLVVGGAGLSDELAKAGYECVWQASADPAAVVQGFAPEVGWQQLAQAAYALQEMPNRPPLPWIATNTDWTIPRAEGIAPGNGTLVSAVHTAVQRLPEFAGKPETPIYETAFKRFGTRNALMLGDRLDTDVRGARAAGIPALLVLTGVDRPKQLLAAASDMRPEFIVANLAELHLPYIAPFQHRDGSFRAGKARVRVDGHIVRVLASGDDPLLLLRAACAAIWDSGLAIYGLQVPELLLIDHWR